MKFMRGSWSVALLAMGMMCAGVSGYARKDKGNSGVYIVGVSDSFSDSTVYITNVQSLDFVNLKSGTDFLPMCSSFSYQLKNYFETKKNMPNRLCAVLFNLRRDKLEREINKVKKNYLAQKGYKVEQLSDFQFEKPAGYDDVQLTPEQEKEARLKAKKEQKELKLKQKEAKKNRKKKGAASGEKGQQPAEPATSAQPEEGQK